MTKGWKKTKEKPKGRLWVRPALLCLLAVSVGFLLWRNGYFAEITAKTPQETASPPAIQTPSVEAGTNRTVREEAYDKDMKALSDLSKNQSVDAQTREDAAKQLRKMVEAHEAEVAIEAALMAAGFTPCLVMLQNGALTVIVDAGELTGVQSATILSLCAAHGAVGVENIRIMTGKR